MAALSTFCCVRPVKVLFPKNYTLYPTSASTQLIAAQSEYKKLSFCIFEDDSGRIMKGNMPYLDAFHFYDVTCQKSPTEDAWRVVKNQRKFIGPLQASLLQEMVTISKEHHNPGVDYTNYIPQQVVRALSAARSNARTIAAIMNAFGSTSWFQDVESSFSWAFREWYAELACPPLNQRSLSGWPFDCVCKLARVCVFCPWELCYFWMNPELPIVARINPCSAMSIAARVGTPYNHEYQLAQMSIVEPFNDARRVGDSYITLSTFQNWSTHNARRLLLKHKLVHIETLAGETAVYDRGDYENELRFSQTLKNVVRVRPDTIAPRMVPRHKWWPFVDANAPRPNEEQQQAIDMAAEQRLYVVGGFPGSGKTTMVLRAIRSMYPAGSVIGLAFTGMAARRLKETIGTGITIHRLIDHWLRCGADGVGANIASASDSAITISPVLAASDEGINNNVVDEDEMKHRYSEVEVVIFEEASTIPSSLAYYALRALPKVCRVYIAGDSRQMQPIEGGSSLMEALLRAFQNTNHAIDLQRSMRVAPGAGALLENLKSICNYNNGDAIPSHIPLSAVPPLHLFWSSDPESDASFVFVPIGNTVAQTATVVRDALRASGVSARELDEGPGARFQIMVHTNSYREQFARAWYDMGRFATIAPFKENSFRVGETIMFLENHYGRRVHKFRSSEEVMNGTVGRITVIADEVCTSRQCQATRVTATDSPSTSPTATRWIQVNLGNTSPEIWVCLNVYNIANITRMPPATVCKMQGHETDIAVIVVERDSSIISRRDFYTACSRGKRRCIVVCQMNSRTETTQDESHNTLRPCPSSCILDIVARWRSNALNTRYWARFCRDLC